MNKTGGAPDNVRTPPHPLPGSFGNLGKGVVFPQYSRLNNTFNVYVQRQVSLNDGGPGGYMGRKYKDYEIGTGLKSDPQNKAKP